MSLLAERLKQLRWMAVPIAAYLVVTLVLPAANGAARHADFVRHAGWVLAGCAAIVATALAVGVIAALAVRARRAFANNRSAPRVASAGGPP